MASSYPSSFDGLPTSAANTDESEDLHPALHNDANAAINAIQTTLGEDPQGAEDDVAARLAAIEAMMETLGGSMPALELVDEQVFDTPGAAMWTKPAGVTEGFAIVTAVPGGFGGGSGRCGAAGSDRSGGAGGASAASHVATLPISVLGATEPVTVGAGGVGGAAVGPATADGLHGTRGGDSTFSDGSNGFLVSCYNVAGYPQNGGRNVAVYGVGYSFGMTVSPDPLTRSHVQLLTVEGVVALSSALAPLVPTGYVQGGSGFLAGLGDAAGGATASTPGGGGGGLAASNAESAGGVGGYAIYPSGAMKVNGGTAGAARTNGGNGNVVSYQPLIGTGGGGGGSSNSSSVSAGSGGDGAGFGSGGGGGGAATSGGTAMSGAGGDGGGGYVSVRTYAVAS